MKRTAFKTIRPIRAALLVTIVAAGIVLRGLLTPPPMPAAVVAFTGLAQPGLAVATGVQPRRAFVAHGSAVSLIDTTTARIIRSTSVRGEPLTLAIDRPRRQLFVVFYNDATLDVLDARSGHLVRTLTLPLHPIHVAFDDVAGLAIVSGYNAASTTQMMATISLTTGAILHTVNLGAGPFGATGSATTVVDQRTHHVFITTVQGVEVLDTRTGASVQHLPIAAGGPDDIVISPLSERVFVTLQGTTPTAGQCVVVSCPTTGRGVMALDARSERVIWRVPLPPLGTRGSSLCALTVDDRTGHVFVADRCGDDHGSGRVYMLDARRGTTLSTTNVSIGPYALATDPQHGHVVMVGRGGTNVLDVQSGARLTTMPWPGNAVAVDERTGRAVIASTFDYQWTRNKFADTLLGFARTSSNHIGLTHHDFGGVSIVRTSP